jgi:hypothetical protein
VYRAALLSAAVAFASVAAAAARRGGRVSLKRATAGAIIVFNLLGILDWARTPNVETPLWTYLLLGTAPTLVAASLVGWLANRRVSLWLQIVAASLAWTGVSILALLAPFYVS